MALALSNGNLKVEAFRDPESMAAVLNRLANNIRKAKKGEKEEIREKVREIAEEKPDLLREDLITLDTMNFLRIVSLVRKAERRRVKKIST